MFRAIGLLRILGAELELACNRGSCGTIFSHANIFNDISPHEPPLQASSSSMLSIRIWSNLLQGIVLTVQRKVKEPT